MSPTDPSSPAPGGETRSGSPTLRLALLAWAELAGLWTIVFSQQSFERIASGPEAFTAVGADRLDVLLVIVLVALVAPTVAWLVEMVIWRLGWVRAARAFHAVLFGAAAAVFYWQFSVRNGFPAGARYLPAIVLLAGGCFLYLKVRVVKQFAELLSLATPVVIAIFAFSYPTINQLLPQTDPPSVKEIRSDTPVVLVVFDEFPLSNLVNERGEIDAKLFPNFARLARSSTWYPNARAVASHTLEALPAIMTGRLPARHPADPERPPPPLPRSFPDNLCSVLSQGGYRLHSSESITQFCGPRYSRVNRLAVMTSRALVPGVIPPGTLPPKVGSWLNRRLGGSPGDFLRGRREEMDRFSDGVDGDPGTFSFEHTLLPHQAWMYLPDGNAYFPDLRPGSMARSGPARDLVYQQVMLQTAFVDRQLGTLISRMRATGIWDTALLIVTADHGLDLSFNGRPPVLATSDDRRLLTPGSAGAILPIPMFVKRPRQRRDHVDRREVTSVDIAPTILAELGVNQRFLQELDGRPLDRGVQASEGPIVAQETGGPVSTTRHQYRTSRRAAKALRDRLFGSGSFYALGGHAELIGTLAAGRPKLALLKNSVDVSPAGTGDDPASLAGRWEFRISSRHPGSYGAVAVAVNGRIVATARPWFDQAIDSWKIGVVLPDPVFSSDENVIKLYATPKR